MKLKIVLDGTPAELEFSRDSDELRFCFQAEGREAHVANASLVRVQPGIYSVLVEGRSFEVKIVPGPRGYFADVQGRHMIVEVIDPRRSQSGSRSFSLEGRQDVAAPMPGKVVRVLVREGDLVEPGQGLLVVEAMKMQNELRAIKAGRVATLRVKVGTTVSGGEVLAVIE
jgi:biotin carboxyl carrier protein